MPAPLQALFRRITATIAGFSFAQKTLAVLGILVLVLGGIGLGAWLGQPKYVPLFSGISAADAQAITDQLHSDNVPYQLTDGGATILVPQAQVYQERMKAAAANLPSSTNQGYSLLNTMGVTTSDFQQTVTYKRAMEGELANTIDAMNGVKTSSVKLAIPQPTVFTDATQDPTASVFVAETPGTTLSGSQVQAIVHLVSASTVGMKPSDVSVIDAAGNVLSTAGSTFAAGTDDQAKTYDAAVQSSVQSMLDKVLGSGNSTVVVNALMDNSSSTKTTDQYTIPTGAPVSSSTSQKETYTGTGAGTASGVLGTSATTNGVSNTATNSGGNGTYSSDSSTSDNVLNKTSTTQQIPAGSVQRQTVSVAVDTAAARKAGVSMNQIQSMVANAAGANSTRGDTVGVQFVSFSQANAVAAKQALAAATAQAQQAQLTAWIRDGVIALAVIAGLITMMIMIRRRRRAVFDEPAPLFDEPTVPLMTLTAIPEPGVLGAVPPAAGAVTAGATPPAPDVIAAGQRKAEIEQLAVSDPRRAADFLLALMDDRQPAS